MKNMWGLAVVFGLVSFLAWGAEVPEGDAFQSLLALILNWNSLAPLAIGSGLIVILVQAMKQFVGDGFIYKRTLVVFLGVVYSVLLSMQQGLGLVESLVVALITSGGAVAIYEALKPLLGKVSST